MPRGGRREKAGRKSGWVNSETQLIRVPKIFASRLIEIAKHLDHGHECQLVQTEFPLDDAGQLSIFSLDDPLPQPLGLRALAKRLDVSSGTLSRYKETTSKSLQWTYEHDKKWGWFYRSKTEKFHPVPPSEFDSLLAELSGEEDYEDF